MPRNLYRATPPAQLTQRARPHPCGAAVEPSHPRRHPGSLHRTAIGTRQIVTPGVPSKFRAGQAGTLLRHTPEGQHAIITALNRLEAWCQARGIQWKVHPQA